MAYCDGLIASDFMCAIIKPGEMESPRMPQLAVKAR